MLCMLMTMVDSPEDKRKIEKLYEKYNRLMYVVAYKILKNKEDSEDVVLESWEKIIKHLDKINIISGQETKSFIVIVVERTAINLYRKNKKKIDNVFSVDEFEECPFFSTKDKALEHVELYDAMRNLPKVYSNVLVLYYINGFSCKEIAEIMNISEDAVNKRLSRARKKLGEELKGNE